MKKRNHGYENRVLYKVFLFCVDVVVGKKEYSYTCNATKNWKEDIMMQSL